MDYRVEVKDQWGRRVAVYMDVPLLEATRELMDGRHVIEGILPRKAAEIGYDFTVELWFDDELFLRAKVTQVNPIWSDTKKLILDRFVHFHEVVSFEAERVDDGANWRVMSTHLAETVDEIVKRSINRTLGPIHYGVAHTAYPDGATREYSKLLARKTTENELEIGGVSLGQWVSGARIDWTAAAAKDGETIEGLVVDGVTWPDLRMMMIDTEETSINPHTAKLHPEVSDWTTAQYDASGYKVRADAATAALQDLIDTKGIDLIELNPHIGLDGTFDDRTDAFGRYLGLVYGGGECFNAAMVEKGHSETLLYDDGRGHVPELELKDFFSYERVQVDTVSAAVQVLGSVDANIDIFEWLTMMGYAAGGYGWSLDEANCVNFRSLQEVDRVVFVEPVLHAVDWETNSDDLVNVVDFNGNQSALELSSTYHHDDSEAIFGERKHYMDNPAFVEQADADVLVASLLDDVAFPEQRGEIRFYHGDTSIRVGDLVEVRNGATRRLTPEVTGEWGGYFSGRLVGRVERVRHSLEGTHLTTTVSLMSPLRTMARPLTTLVQSQAGDSSQFQLRLDDDLVGLDSSFHVD